MSLSRKDYVAIADVISSVEPRRTRCELARNMAHVMSAHSGPGGFNRPKFLEACNAGDDVFNDVIKRSNGIRRGRERRAAMATTEHGTRTNHDTCTATIDALSAADEQEANA